MQLGRLITRILPATVVLTVACGLGYAGAQQVLRSGANDPQVQLAEDAARSLDAGATPAGLVGPGSAAAGLAGPAPVSVATSLAPFLEVFDAGGVVVASNATLDGSAPIPPAGVLAAARASGRDVVTWQPRAGVRIAAVAIPWSGGTVLAGRSLRVVEEREDQALLLAAAAWMAGLVALVAAGIAASWVDGAARRTD